MGDFVIFTIYLFYGAAFFAIGVTILARLKTFATLRIAGLFWLLAVFAFLHSFHEWLELFLVVGSGTADFLLQIRHLSLFLLLLSFLVLCFFGINLHGVLNRRIWPYLSALLVILTAIFLYVNLFREELLLLAEVDRNIRWFFGLPATVLTGSGFILYAGRLRALSARGASNFTGAGLAFLLYGYLTGLVPSTETLFEMPVQLWRGLSAFIILHFIMRALDHFLAERDALIEDKLQRVAHSEKLSAVGRMAAGVAHEINNPLANVSLQLELLQADPAVGGLPEKSRQRLAGIERNVEKSAAIARELLFLAGRPEEQPRIEPVDLHRIVLQAWQSVISRQPDCRLRNQLPEPLLVLGSALKLEQLFANLFSNAMDVMPDGGEIRVAGRTTQRQTIVTVTDQGPGINPQNREKVLEPFFTTKEPGSGTGLGLAISYGIMFQHGGSLDLADGSDGRGTTVILTFNNPKNEVL